MSLDKKVGFSFIKSMKISVEFSEKELKDIAKFSSQSKKGPAIREIVLEALRRKKIRQMTEEVLSGKWGIDWEYSDFEEKEENPWKK